MGNLLANTTVGFPQQDLVSLATAEEGVVTSNIFESHIHLTSSHCMHVHAGAYSRK